MAKSRIIIADTDINYILPLQLKFAEDYFEQVDLEIITDRDYFAALFATPQKADILVVSETLYDVSLLRHDIGSIFLMTERFDSGKTAELRVNQIYKYTSIKEIFNEITGKSPVVTAGGKGAGQTQVILVYSAGGGTGKTTVSMGIAAALTQNYKKSAVSQYRAAARHLPTHWKTKRPLWGRLYTRTCAQAARTSMTRSSM